MEPNGLHDLGSQARCPDPAKPGLAIARDDAGRRTRLEAVHSGRRHPRRLPRSFHRVVGCNHRLARAFRNVVLGASDSRASPRAAPGSSPRRGASDPHFVPLRRSRIHGLGLERRDGLLDPRPRQEPRPPTGSLRERPEHQQVRTSSPPIPWAHPEMGSTRCVVGRCRAAQRAAPTG